MPGKYLLFSLEDEKVKKLGDVISNPTSRKIINLLSEKEASESEIAKELEMPLNTVDYNVKKLVKAGLIEEKKHLWSSKGKRIPIYRVSNKHIVISPKKTYPSKIKSVFPVVFVLAIFTAFILWYTRARSFVQEVAPKSEEIMITGARDFVVEGEAVTVISFLASINILEWFLIVIWILVVIYVILNLRRD